MSSAEPNPERVEDIVSRRKFLRAGGLGVVGLSLADPAAWGEMLRGSTSRHCILVLMTGGASQLETFDPKPGAAADIRGTLAAIETSIPGIFLNETLPNLAQRADRFSLLRSIYHRAAPIHETGLQLLQTGQLAWKGVRFPAVGSVLTEGFGDRGPVPTSIVVPKILENPGVAAYLGQQPADYDEALVPKLADAVGRESESVRRMYGSSRYGELLLQSRILVEQGVRCITVNLHDQLGAYMTWDAHGDASCGPATIADCRDRLCPAFDRAMSGLLDDLAQRGLLEDTLVMAVGEMGRSPRINARGGRDHWTKCWSALVAGGGTLGGQVIGASDATASYPIDRPIELSEIPSTILSHFGVDGSRLRMTVGKEQIPLISQPPIHELWGRTVEQNVDEEPAAAAV